MNNLICFDVDDTLFHNNSLVDVFDEFGIMVDQILGRDYYRENYGPDYTFSFDSYACAKTFYQCDPIEDMINLAKQHLADPRDTVYCVTAREEVDDFALYIKKFHDHGVEIDPNQVLFARTGVDNLGQSSHTLKTPVFTDILQRNVWGTATVYDDNLKNVETFCRIAGDFNIPARGFLITDGIHKRVF